MEWAGLWASMYPSNDGKEGRVDLIRVDHKGDVSAPAQRTACALHFTAPQLLERSWRRCCCCCCF